VANGREIQDAKETARRLALQLGWALERRDGRVEAVDVEGDRKVLVDGQTDETIWQATLEQIKAQVADGDVKKATVHRPPCRAIKMHADGGSRGNPGPSAAAFVLYDADSGQFLEEGGEFMGVTTNNQAEYHSLKLGLQHAKLYQPKSVEVFMDSQLVVNQLNGIYKIRNRDLWPVFSAIRQLAQEFKEVRFTHVPRAENMAADRVVNQILDSRPSD
jgi:ribonuclease HI